MPGGRSMPAMPPAMRWSISAPAPPENMEVMFFIELSLDISAVNCREQLIREILGVELGKVKCPVSQACDHGVGKRRHLCEHSLWALVVERRHRSRLHNLLHVRPARLAHLGVSCVVLFLHLESKHKLHVLHVLEHRVVTSQQLREVHLLLCQLVVEVCSVRVPTLRQFGLALLQLDIVLPYFTRRVYKVKHALCKLLHQDVRRRIHFTIDGGFVAESSTHYWPCKAIMASRSAFPKFTWTAAFTLDTGWSGIPSMGKME